MEHDLIISGGIVLTMAPGEEPVPDGAVAVKDGTIVAVGTAAELAGATAARRLDAAGGLIMPGMVNTHTHLAMTLLRGFADDLPLKLWLEEHIWPAEAKIMDAESVALGTRWAAVESLLAGVTCVCDMYFHASEVVAAVTEVGLRAVVTEPLIDNATPACPTPEDALVRQRELLESCTGHRLVTPAVAPHSPYSVQARYLAQEAELAEEFGAPLMIHLAETRWEVETIIADKGVSPVAYLADLGVLSERTIAAHCVHVSEDDLDTLAEFEVGVASNPVSNLKLASGVAPVPQMIDRGLKVGLGTDGAASNNTLDLLRDAQLCALLYKGVTGDPTVIPARRLAELLTIGGARVLGLADRIGSLEVGKRADVVCLSMDAPGAVPSFDPYSHLAYAARAADVRHVVVDGATVVEDGAVTTVDEASLRREVRARTEALR